MLISLPENPLGLRVDGVLISLLESLQELNEDGLKSLSQSHRYNHTDIVCIASALVVVVCFSLKYNQLISLILL